jgi:hypothetical protein
MGTMPPFLHKSSRIGIPAIFIMVLMMGGCASRSIESFDKGRPVLKPEIYFAGRTHSWGIFETPGGQPTKTIRTETSGRWDGARLHFEQDIQFQDGSTEHRSWLIHRLDAHHYTATGTGIIGVAHGAAYGNVFHLDFTLDAAPGNPLGHVHMSQWMYLQEGGKTLVNRDTLTKAGVIITEITEQFQKDW